MADFVAARENDGMRPSNAETHPTPRILIGRRPR